MNIDYAIIEKAETFLKDYYNQSTYLKDHPVDLDYRLHHSHRVANIGKQIAQREGFNITDTIVGCLLHDISYSEEFPTHDDWLNHGRNSAKIARPFLLSIGIPENRVNQICYAIAIHVDGNADFEGEPNAFTETISDADNIDRNDVYRIYEWLQYQKFNEMTCNGKMDFVNKQLDKLRNYLDQPLATPTATEMWKDKINFYISFYERMENQLANSTSILFE